MRSAQRILKQTNELARRFYARRGYIVPKSHKFYEFHRVNYHPDERVAWDCAVIAQEMLTDTLIRDVFDELEMEYDD